MGDRQVLLRSTLTGSLTFIGSVIAVLVKYLSAWDECWGKGIESPSGSNVIDGIGVANPFHLFNLGACLDKALDLDLDQGLTIKEIPARSPPCRALDHAISNE